MLSSARVSSQYNRRYIIFREGEMKHMGAEVEAPIFCLMKLFPYKSLLLSLLHHRFWWGRDVKKSRMR
jgi:hypothetical protein